VFWLVSAVGCYRATAQVRPGIGPVAVVLPV